MFAVNHGGFPLFDVVIIVVFDRNEQHSAHAAFDLDIIAASRRNTIYADLGASS